MNRPTWPTVTVPFTVPLLAALVLGGVTAAPAGAARAVRHRASVPAADCQPFGATPCLLPFPSNLFTRPDRATPTGLRVDLPASAMPVNKNRERISVAPYDRGDGFSPGSTVIIHVPGLDNSRAFQRTGAAPLVNMGEAFTHTQPIVIIDEATGRRQLIWSELDATATSPQNTDLLIHPGKDFTDGHTYVVALRNLRNAAGQLIAAPAWFERLRDDRPLPPQERLQRARYVRIFTALRRAGIGRGHLYAAWNFTVASRQSLTSRLLAIRNDAFAQLGDHDLADGIVQGRAPSFTVASTTSLTPQLLDVQGTFKTPCYLITCGATATSGFHYSSRSPDALPTQIPGNVATARFECIIPSSAGNPQPARISLYGHGFLSTRHEVEAGHVQQMALAHNIIFCATDWWGLASPDKPYDVNAMMHLNEFPAIVDRIQQGVLNTLYLGRLMINPEGFASSPAFQIDGRPVIDTSHLYYDGNSDGGILGGITTAVAPDFRRAVLGVSAIGFANMLIPRTPGIGSFGQIVFRRYPDQSLHPVILDLMQQLWDRGDPDGYAQYMTSDPLPDTPSHVVLMQIAYGDFQVSNFASAQEARTIGADAYEPALDLSTNRVRDRNLLYGVPPIPSYPWGGSAIVVWDSGAGRVAPPPLANIPPVGPHDPHSDVRYTPAAQLQKSDFLEPDGAVIDVCGGRPCRTAVYTP